MAETGSASQANLVEFGIGVVALALGIFVLAFSTTTVGILVFLLAIGLIVIGLAGVAFPYVKKGRPQWQRVAIPVFGAISIIIGALVLALPTFGSDFLVFLLAIGLLFLGTHRISSEAMNPEAPTAHRAFHGLLGAAILGLALAVIVFQGLGEILFILFLGLGLLLAGLANIISGYRSF